MGGGSYLGGHTIIGPWSFGWFSGLIKKGKSKTSTSMYAEARSKAKSIIESIRSKKNKKYRLKCVKASEIRSKIKARRDARDERKESNRMEFEALRERLREERNSMMRIKRDEKENKRKLKFEKQSKETKFTKNLSKRKERRIEHAKRMMSTELVVVYKTKIKDEPQKVEEDRPTMTTCRIVSKPSS